MMPTFRLVKESVKNCVRLNVHLEEITNFTYSICICIYINALDHHHRTLFSNHTEFTHSCSNKFISDTNSISFKF